jgi:hypothetical protein
MCAYKFIAKITTTAAVFTTTKNKGGQPSFMLVLLSKIYISLDKQFTLLIMTILIYKLWTCTVSTISSFLTLFSDIMIVLFFPNLQNFESMLSLCD